MTYSIGLYDKIYRNSGTYASPVLVVIDIVENVNMADERNEATLKIRRNDVEVVLPGQRKLSFEFKLSTDVDNASWNALQDAYLNKTTIELFGFYKYIDDAGQPDTASEAHRATCNVLKFPLDQPLEEFDSGDVVCKPSANAANPPEKYVAA